MGRKQSVGSGGATGWLFQRVSGIALVVLLLLHFVLMHFTGDYSSYDSVAARLATPLFKVVDMTFLTLGLWHGLYGVWLVGGDYLQRYPVARTLLWCALVLGGTMLIALGAVTIVPFAPQT